MSVQLGEISDALLHEAVDQPDLAILRKVVKEMCAASDECRQEAIKRLITQAAPRPGPKSSTEGSHKKTSPSNKRKQESVRVWARYEKCSTCKHVFDVHRNNKKACRTHEGNLELDPEAFPDDDQVMYDLNSIDVETDWRRESCPEGFIYDCCDQDCKSKGCVIQQHIVERIPSGLLGVYEDE